MTMKKSVLVVLSVFLLGVLTANGAEKEKTHLKARLNALNEIPTNVTAATGTFKATINDDSSITFTLTYRNLTTPAFQAHIHVGAPKTNGGVAIFLCGPASPPAHQTCPNDATNSGMVTDTVTAADVVGPAGQGVAKGDFAKVVRAIVNGDAYVNVHTAPGTTFPGGETRGQIVSQEDEDDE